MLRGADLFKRFVQSPARRVIKYAFDKHLFATNVTISLTLSGIGDILQQHHNIIQQQQHSWDRARTRHMTCTGVTVGALCHHWYVLSGPPPAGTLTGSSVKETSGRPAAVLTSVPHCVLPVPGVVSGW
ncbi:hypothetical protein O3P69_002970 [Scylla paramamosain]|uniref:Uncharacterized protein n=1 Tax=Scylla paramamosain TaxID=85552 RepID=A0AAW0UIP0_SCYPA